MYYTFPPHKIHCQQELCDYHSSVFLWNFNLPFEYIPKWTSLLVLHQKIEIVLTFIYSQQLDSVATLPQASLYLYLCDHLLLLIRMLHFQSILINHLHSVDSLLLCVRIGRRLSILDDLVNCSLSSFSYFLSDVIFLEVFRSNNPLV